jgi:hypothetical protein
LIIVDLFLCCCCWLQSINALDTIRACLNIHSGWEGEREREREIVREIGIERECNTR